MKGTPKALLLNGFTNEEIREFLNCYKKDGNLPKDIIFATVTETALNWTVKDWLKELSREHKEFKKLKGKK